MYDGIRTPVSFWSAKFRGSQLDYGVRLDTNLQGRAYIVQETTEVKAKLAGALAAMIPAAHATVKRKEGTGPRQFRHDRGNCPGHRQT